MLDGVDALGLAGNTHVIVTSDNGMHLGEHRLPMGKEHPYDHDIRVPMVVRGPGIAAGATLPAPVTLVDLTATVLELAGGVAHSGPALDGLSFAQALSGGNESGTGWVRNFSYSEHFDGRNSWVHVRFPGEAPGALARASFTRWCTNQSEVYDLEGDAQQLRNIAGDPGRGSAAEAQGRALALALLACSGTTCAQPVPGVGAAAVPCYKITH